MLGATTQVPVPAGQPTPAAVYQVSIFRACPLSFTQSSYQVAPGTAFQV